MHCSQTVEFGAVGDPRLLPGGAADLDLSRGIALLDAETPRVRSERGVHVHGFGNPHYWLDPENARPITDSSSHRHSMRGTGTSVSANAAMISC